jgi:hypothetical protein
MVSYYQFEFWKVRYSGFGKLTIQGHLQVFSRDEEEDNIRMYMPAKTRHDPFLCKE